MVDDGVAFAVEALCQQLFRQRETNRVRQPLAERARGYLEAYQRWG